MHEGITFSLAVLLVLAAPGRADAQACHPPVNDDCSGAIDITFDQLPLSFAGLLGCDNFMVDRPYFDVFFRYDCTVSGDYVLDMCGSLGDTYMRVYTDGCGFFPASSWVEDDDSCGGSPNSVDPLITTTLQAGTSYWIELGSWRVDDFFPPNANDPYVFHMEFIGGGVPVWTDLGGGTTGSNGAVTLAGSGSLVGGTPVGLELTNAPPNAPTLAWVSLTSAPQGFFGGTIHARPPTAQIFLTADTAGTISLSSSWPSGIPPGTDVWFQFLVSDPSVAWGITLSNAVQATTP